ncbi:MAG: class B sortase [Clostridiaceae bacterium]
MKSKILITIEVIAFVVLIGLLGIYAKDKDDIAKAKKAASNIKNTVRIAQYGNSNNVSVGEVKSGSGTSVKNPDEVAKEEVRKIESLHPNVKAILIIPGTDIVFPVVHGEDNEFYLNHDKDGNPSKFGEIFIDYRNNEKFKDQNTVIYGHNISYAKVMFSELLNYKNQDFFEAHKKIMVYTAEGLNLYEVQSVFVANPNEPYRSISFKDNEYSEFTKKYFDKSEVKSDFKESSSMLTLSTCFDDNSRLVIQAVRVK